VTPGDERLLRLPKAELHVHLDGSLRPRTLLDLADDRGVELPAQDVESLARFMLVTDAQRLEDYLDRFRLTLAVMQDADAIERIAYELVEDHALESVRCVEVRFAPVLNTEGGLRAEEALEAALAGLRRAERRYPIRTSVIVCALRTLPPPSALAMVRLALSFRDRGVCAFDLAGAEEGYPVAMHREAFEEARAVGLPVTIHAGEGFGVESIRQALDVGGASRIGHGTRLHEDPELMARVRDERIPLEICLTSNVQTRVSETYEEHPLRRYYDAGLVVSLCTDNRLMSGVTLTEEYELARDRLGFTDEELRRIARFGFEAAFLPDATRQEMLTAFDRTVAAG
jgi:adenosine deaminase